MPVLGVAPWRVSALGHWETRLKALLGAMQQTCVAVGSAPATDAITRVTATARVKPQWMHACPRVQAMPARRACFAVAQRCRQLQPGEWRASTQNGLGSSIQVASQAAQELAKAELKKPGEGHGWQAPLPSPDWGAYVPPSPGLHGEQIPGSAQP